MNIKCPLFILITIVAVTLSACAPSAPSNLANEAGTMAALTLQAMTPKAGEPAVPSVEPPTATVESAPLATATATTAPAPAPMVPPPANSATILARGNFMPYAADYCELMRANFEQAIGAPVLIESAPFTDRVSGGSGTACRIHGTGNALTYELNDGAFNALTSLLISNGWTEDQNYSAAGPTGLATGFRKGGSLGILSVGWHPAPGVNCPNNQPISACDLTQEQKLYDAIFDVADVVVYNPPLGGCATWQSAVQAVVPIPMVLETVDFTDFEQNRGTACQFRAEGTGANIANIPDLARALDAALTPFGWLLVNGADGPTGTGREYNLNNLTAIVYIKWRPSPDANCPSGQPISACPLTPEQKLVTVTVAFAEK